MLTKVEKQTGLGEKNPEILIGQAGFPALFPHALEFNPPAHGTWNIVHIGMRVPGARQIYVCAINCMRGVILTAAEMGEQERFSFVILREEDLAEGTVEEITLEGVTDILRRLPELPPAVLLFPVCTHHFLGCDMKHIYRELETRFPGVDFIQGFMDPIMQKEGLTPDQKLRIAMYDVLPPQPVRRGRISIIGGNTSIAASSDLHRIAGQMGKELVQMPQCRNYQEYLELGASVLLLGLVPNSRLAVTKTAKRLGRAGMYLPMCFGFAEIEAQQKALLELLFELEEKQLQEGAARAEADLVRKKEQIKKWHEEFLTANKAECSRCLKLLAEELQGTRIRIDYTAHPRPLGLARLLLSHGFHVDKVYINAVSGEEKEDFLWLKEQAPGLILASTIWPECRVRPRTDGLASPILAIGQQAAWFSGTDYFVNMVEGGDLQGFDGILKLTDLMRAAMREPKDTRDLIPRKGLGCQSCI